MNPTSEQNALRSDRAALQRELESAGVVFRGKVCKCPFHDDRAPSAGLYEKDGVWRFKCQACGAGGDIFDIRAKLAGTKPTDELRAVAPVPATRSAPRDPPPTVYPSVEVLVGSLSGVEAVYRYIDPATKHLDLLIVRMRGGDGKKKFIQCRSTEGGVVMQAPAKPWPIYNRARVMAADTVVVVEGEKCVHALYDVGIVATTSPGGALKGEYADWRPLAGKTVILWPDNDAPEDAHPNGKGVTHMRQVQKILEQLKPAPRMLWLEPTKIEGMPVKGDVVDVLGRYPPKDYTNDDKKVCIQLILDEAEPLGASGELRARLEETMAGKRRSLPFGEFKGMTEITRALSPGTVTCLCGEGGSSKSLFMTQAMLEWHQRGIRACIYELEDSRAYHMNRALAQVEGIADLNDSNWIEANPDLVQLAMDKNSAFFDSFGKCIWEAPEDQVSLEMLKVWVLERAKAGFEIICIDPITAAVSEEKPWVADQHFLMDVKTSAVRYGARVILVTHPKQGNVPKGKESMAGGAAYQRFSHTVLWLEHMKNPKDVKVQPLHDIPAYTQINRSVQIRKARNGRGAGGEVGFWFESGSLRFMEKGLVLPGESKKPSEGESE